MVDHSMDYSFAGKGVKARQRLRIEDVNANTMNVKPRKKDTRKRYERSPVMEKQRAKEVEDATSAYSVSSLKTKLRLMTLADIGYLDQMAMLKREGINVSGVTVGNLRAELREIIKLLERENLLDTDTLERWRKRRTKTNGERSK